MKILRVVLALIVMVAMLYIARTNSRGRPEELSGTDGAYTFSMTSVPKLIERESGRVTVSVIGLQPGDRVLFRTSQIVNLPAEAVADFTPVPMLRTENEDEFYMEVTAGPKGGRFHYFIQVVDSTGGPLGEFAAEDGAPFFLRYIGEVPPVVMGGHILFIFATVFCVAMALIHGLRVIGGGQGLGSMAKYLFWAMVFCFIGGYPLGIPMNWYAFGGTWEGVPFGTDATDNKTQLLFVYLVFASLASFGSLTGRRLGHDLFGPKTLGWIGIGSFAVMLFICLVPHSIQFEPGFTYTFCYTWMAIVAALYLLGRLKSKTGA